MAGPVLRLGAGGRTAHVLMTSMVDGDLAVTGDPATLGARRRALVDLPWTWLQQVHGSTVVVVDRPGQHAGERADAAVSAVLDAALAVHVADCAPVAFVGSGGVGRHRARRMARPRRRRASGDGVGARAHVDAAGELTAVVGPCIHHECYEFGEHDLDLVAAVGGTE